MTLPAALTRDALENVLARETLRAAHGEPSDLSAPEWERVLWAARPLGGEILEDVVATYPGAHVPQLLLPAQRRTGDLTGVDAGDPLWRILRRWPGVTVILAATGALERLPEGVAGVLGLDGAWLLEHSGHGAARGDEVLLRHAWPQLTEPGARDLLAAMLRSDAAVEAGHWKELVTHPGIDAAARAPLLARRVHRTGGPWTEAMCRRSDLSPREIRRVARHMHHSWHTLPWVPDLGALVARVTRPRRFAPPWSLLQHPQLSEAEGLHLLRGTGPFAGAGRARATMDLLISLPEDAPASWVNTLLAAPLPDTNEWATAQILRAAVRRGPLMLAPPETP